jgi:predicted DNA-binding transcriptional regulator AlpA
MATPRKAPPPTELVPHFIYTPTSVTVQHVLGASPGQIRLMIKKGRLPKPVKLFAGGRATGFTGKQLIEFMEQRSQNV